MSEYERFLASKRKGTPSHGISVASDAIHSSLYDFQRDTVLWALRKGRAAIWQAVGLGKTLEQVEWARQIGGRTLIVAPLAVSQQTVKMARAKLDLDVRYVRSHDAMPNVGIAITNYEMLHAFVGCRLDGMVLDESAILAHIDGATRRLILDHFADIPFKLSCTATPCPNDVTEIASQAEFLGIETRSGVLSTYFVHDEDGWRLRGHARQPFFRWLASWAQAMQNPSDLGYDGSAFILPSLDVRECIVDTRWTREGELFPGQLKGITDRANVRKQSIKDRIGKVAEIANGTGEQVLIWCGLNDEADACVKAIPDCVEVHGTQDLETKVDRLLGFADGKYRVLVTKGKIAGHGLNLQSCHKMVFMGLNDSFQLFHQSIGRCYRYMQKHPVTVDIIVSDHEVGIVQNVKRKAREADELMHGIIDAAKEYERLEIGTRDQPEEDFSAITPMRRPIWLT